MARGWLPALLRTLAENGFVEGRNLRVDVRSSSRYEDLPALAAELARAGVSVIYALGTANAAVAAKAATTAAGNN